MSCQSQPAAAAEAGQKNGISRLSSKKAYMIGLAIGGTAAAAGTYFFLSRTNAGKTAWRAIEDFADKKNGVASNRLTVTTSTTALVSVACNGAVVVADSPVGNGTDNNRLTNVAMRALQTNRVTDLLTAGDAVITPAASQSNIRALSPAREEEVTTPPISPDKPGLTSIEPEPVELTMPENGKLPGAKRFRSSLRMALGVNGRGGTIYGKIDHGFVLFQQNKRGQYEETGLAIAPALTVTGLSRDKGIQYQEDTTRWGILHVPSGRMVSGHMEDGQLVDGWPFKNPDDATVVGRMLANTDNWTQELDDLTHLQMRGKEDLISKYARQTQQRRHEETDKGA